MKKIHYSILASSLLIFSCNSNETKEDHKKNEEGKTEQTNIPKDTAKIVWNDMDTTILPTEDFFLFCNGTWIKNTEIPEEEKRWSSFNVLNENNEKKLVQLLEEMQNNENQPAYKQMVGDFYTSFIDSTKRNELGIEPIQPILKKIDDLESKEELLIEMIKIGVPTPFSFGIEQDLVKNEQHSAYISQSGLGLPNKTYYLDKNKEEIRIAYKAYMKSMFQRLGIDEATAKSNMETVYAMEEKMAKVSMSPIELRNYEEQYNPTALSDFSTSYPNLNWNSIFTGIGSKAFDTIIVSQPSFMANYNSMLTSEAPENWKIYFKWNTINEFASSLDDETAMLSFDFYSKTLQGVQKRKPGWKRAIAKLTRNPLGEALGRAFVDKYFSEEAKVKVNTMVDNLMDAFKDRLDQLEWMGPETKVKALEKLASFGRKLGFPDEWKTYDGLVITSDNYVNNTIALHQFSLKENLDKLGEPIDNNEWGMPPHMVNAYYHPLKNEIAFPAGIMQPPFFDANASDAVNYGRIGMVIGHEFTHGFDDQGAKFNAEGAMKDWWTSEDKNKFDERAAVLGETFDAFCPFEDVCVQSKLTMGENIADLGGLTLAYYAYKKTDEYKASKKIHGYTPDQQFFIAFAQLWKYKIRDEALKQQIATDPHSPGMYRVNGPLMNMPEFFAAFEVKESDKMRNTEEKVARIW